MIKCYIKINLWSTLYCYATLIFKSTFCNLIFEWNNLFFVKLEILKGKYGSAWKPALILDAEFMVEKQTKKLQLWLLLQLLTLIISLLLLMLLLLLPPHATITTTLVRPHGRLVTGIEKNSDKIIKLSTMFRYPKFFNSFIQHIVPPLR